MNLNSPLSALTHRLDDLSSFRHLQPLLGVLAAKRDRRRSGGGDTPHDAHAAAVCQLHRNSLIVLPARTSSGACAHNRAPVKNDLSACLNRPIEASAMKKGQHSGKA